jgi:hypothetical protein
VATDDFTHTPFTREFMKNPKIKDVQKLFMAREDRIETEEDRENASNGRRLKESSI